MLANTSVLVVDDEPELAEVVCFGLRLHGLKPIAAYNGLEALKILQGPHGSEIQAIISDIRMPECDGLELLKTLRDQGRELPAILMTGYADVIEEDLSHIGVRAVITKPFELDDMLAKIEALTASTPDSPAA